MCFGLEIELLFISPNNDTGQMVRKIYGDDLYPILKARSIKRF